jgi:hypothetical protein
MYQRVPWPKLENHLRGTWKQSQHSLAIAPTGRGKTVLMRKLMPMRRDVVMFGTKKDDEEYDKIIREDGFTRIKKWPPPHYVNKALFWPDAGRASMAEMRAIQTRAFSGSLDHIFHNGKWTVVFDELHWISEALKQRDNIAHMHHQGRSSKLTFLDGFQRPAFVPVIVYSSATNVVIWGTNAKKDLQALQSVAKLDALSYRELSHVMGELDEFEFVYVNTRGKQPPIISQVAY